MKGQTHAPPNLPSQDASPIPSSNYPSHAVVRDPAPPLAMLCWIKPVSKSNPASSYASFMLPRQFHKRQYINEPSTKFSRREKRTEQHSYRARCDGLLILSDPVGVGGASRASSGGRDPACCERARWVSRR